MFKAIALLVRHLPTIIRLIKTLSDAWDKAQAEKYIKKVDATVKDIRKADNDEKRKALAGRASALAYELRKSNKPKRPKKKVVRRVGG